MTSRFGKGTPFSRAVHSFGDVHCSRHLGCRLQTSGTTARDQGRGRDPLRGGGPGSGSQGCEGEPRSPPDEGKPDPGSGYSRHLGAAPRVKRSVGESCAPTRPPECVLLTSGGSGALEMGVRPPRLSTHAMSAPFLACAQHPCGDARPRAGQARMRTHTEQAEVSHSPAFSLLGVTTA